MAGKQFSINMNDVFWDNFLIGNDLQNWPILEEEFAPDPQTESEDC